MTIRTLTESEVKRLEQRFSRENIDSALQTAAQWRDYSLETSDGRTFAYFEDGSSILHRMQAAHVRNYLSAAEEDWITKQQGAIVEVGCEDHPAMWYGGDYEELRSAWRELHRLCGLPLTPNELGWFREDE